MLNRGVDKRDIFLDIADRMRFINALDLFNDTIPAENTHRVISGVNVGPTRSNKEPLVQIHGWCLMKNHYHLLVSENIEGGLTKFLMKLNVGYAKYFNERYQRSGTLFQGRTKKVRIARDAHFLYILHYIHLNPLDFMNDARLWREHKIDNVSRALAYLENYKWSSYKDYCSKSIFPNITTTDLFKDVFEDYPKALKKDLKDLELSELKPLLLE